MSSALMRESRVWTPHVRNTKLLKSPLPRRPIRNNILRRTHTRSLSPLSRSHTHADVDDKSWLTYLSQSYPCLLLILLMSTCFCLSAIIFDIFSQKKKKGENCALQQHPFFLSGTKAKLDLNYFHRSQFANVTVLFKKKKIMEDAHSLTRLSKNKRAHICKYVSRWLKKHPSSHPPPLTPPRLCLIAGVSIILNRIHVLASQRGHVQWRRQAYQLRAAIFKYIKAISASKYANPAYYTARPAAVGLIPPTATWVFDCRFESCNSLVCLISYPP